MFIRMFWRFSSWLSAAVAPFEAASPLLSFFTPFRAFGSSSFFYVAQTMHTIARHAKPIPMTSGT